MKWLNNLTHKILADNRLLLLLTLIVLIVYPLKQWRNASICQERSMSEFNSTKRELIDLAMGTYYRVLCD